MKLQAKALSVFVPLALITATIIVTLARFSVHKILVGELAQRAIGQPTKTFAELAAKVETGRESAVLPALQSLAAATQASYGLALDMSGRVIAHTNVLETGRIYADGDTFAALRRPNAGYRVARAEGRQILEVTIPLRRLEEGDFFLAAGQAGRRPVGALRLGLPMEEVLQTESRIVREVGLVLALAGGVFLALIVFLLARLLEPIEPLTEAAASIGAGRYGVSVPIMSRDELGALAAAFNRMSSDLASTTVSKRFLDDILGGMLDALIVLDEEGRVRLANAAAQRLLGRTESELIGASEARFIAAEDLSRGAAARGKNVELRLTAASGETIPVLLSSARLEGADGRPAGFVLVARDIRERKELESRVAQSEKLSAIGQLAAGVAHEINNPLGVILGFAQSLCRTIDDNSELSLPLRSIERESLRCKELVQSLLTFARQERRQLEPMDLRAAVSSALVLLQPQVRLRNVDLSLEPLAGSTPLMIDGNANQIRQIVINLCSNALDAAALGGHVRVACRRREDKGRAWARLEVRDDGAGIPPEIRRRIFDPFFTTKEPGKGTGLGLSLVYELVRHHHGLIDFESQEGLGTSFFVDFPLREDA